MYLPQKLRRFPRKMSAWAGRVVSCTEMYRYGPRVTFCPSLWNTIAIIIMKSGFIRKEADLICLFGSLREKRAKARLTGWTLDRSKSWANSEAAHWPTLLSLVFSLAKSSHCSKLRGKVIVKHNIEFLQNKETIGRKHNNLCIKTTSFPGAAWARHLGDWAWAASRHGAEGIPG